MQLDINPDWVNFNSYDLGARQRRARQRPLRRHRHRPLPRPDDRDFIAVIVRGTVVAGAEAKLGVAPLAATVKVK